MIKSFLCASCWCLGWFLGGSEGKKYARINYAEICIKRNAVIIKLLSMNDLEHRICKYGCVCGVFLCSCESLEGKDVIVQGNENTF